MIEGIISSLVAAAIGWIAGGLYNKKKHSIFRFVRKFKAYNSGLQGYYYSFPPDENKKCWAHVKNRFCYLGVSANTIINDLQDLMKSPEGHRLEYHVLLMNPGNRDLILKQEAYKNGYSDFNSLDAAKKDKLFKDVEILRETIMISAEKLKCAGCKVFVKYFDEFLPWWMYVFDNDRIFVGLLEFNKDGRNSPLVILEKNNTYFTLFDAFETNWRRIWDSSKPA